MNSHLNDVISCENEKKNVKMKMKTNRSSSIKNFML